MLILGSDEKESSVFQYGDVIATVCDTYAYKYSKKENYMPVKKGNIPWNKGKKVELTDYLKSIRRTDEDVFVENSTYARHHIKRRIVEDNKIEYRCSCCGIGPEWNKKPMPLILDHINGKNNDNRIENLRFVCSNCDSQLDTYKSRNRKK